MLLADTMAIFFVVLGLLITFPCLWLLCSAIWPRWVEQNYEAVERGVFKSFFIGIPVVAVAVVIVAVLGKLPASAGQIGGIMSFSFLMVFAQTGVAGLAKLIGRRLESPADLERPWKGTLRGGIVLVLSYLLPLVGWFLLLPGSIIVGAGSATRVLCGRIWMFIGRKAQSNLPQANVVVIGSNSATDGNGSTTTDGNGSPHNLGSVTSPSKETAGNN